MNKKILITAVSLLLIAVTTVGATLAYFSYQTDPVINVFTLGNVSATIREPKWNVKQGKMMPGDTESKDPTIILGANSETAWVFIKLSVSDAAAFQAAVGTSNDILTGIATNLASGWTLMNVPSASGGDIITYIYGYNTILNAGESTAPIFTAITLPGIVDGTAAYASLSDGFTISAQGYVVQSANISTLAAAYTLAITEFGF